MERMIAVSDHFPDVTADVEGVERTYPLGLRLTYDFDPKARQMAIAIGLLPPVTPDDRGSDEDARWKNVFFRAKQHTVVHVMVSVLTTASALLKEAKLPDELRFAVQSELELMAKSMEPFVQDCFQGRTCEPNDTLPLRTPAPVNVTEPTFTPEPEPSPEPEPDTVPIPKVEMVNVPDPTPTPEPAPEPPAPPVTATPAAKSNVLVVVKRDVSPAFKRERGACTLKYTLFSEPHAFRATIEGDITDAKTGRKQHKHAEFIRRDVESILRDLRSDNTAYEIACFFGDTSSQTVHRVSCVLQTGFGGGTEQKMRSDAKAFEVPPTPIPIVPTDDQATIALSPVSPDAPQYVEVFNGGQYIKVPA